MYNEMKKVAEDYFNEIKHYAYVCHPSFTEPSLDIGVFHVTQPGEALVGRTSIFINDYKKHGDAVIKHEIDKLVRTLHESVDAYESQSKT